MKFLWFAILVAACIAAVVEGKRSGFQTEKKTKQCPSTCTADYNPVCALDTKNPNSRPRLFGNKCALSVHNCEMSTNMTPVDLDRCKNVGGIRLS